MAMRVSETMERGRRAHPVLPATQRGETRGFFVVDALRIIASDGVGWPFPPPAWEHVSVSAERRVPTWAEMCWVRNQFWEPEDVVLQFHPRASEYVNVHPNCLHMWRPVGVAFPTPPTLAV